MSGHTESPPPMVEQIKWLLERNAQLEAEVEVRGKDLGHMAELLMSANYHEKYWREKCGRVREWASGWVDNKPCCKRRVGEVLDILDGEGHE